ncbi:hypothetical protein ATK17_2353 [Branchiibius hedensis]|uniref:Uncharacterized protein n=1 Tax=Branchiibius hedensis TaxID=672460 RepID=A0A2Y8ZXL8_9MICO|nr:hypothetical protein [Branchiibius hedensis]PWJ26207.1 hypothetical protein ATK17_2353 [Branchiibius hedensis]SSA35019.1 hypothetical protein SAMN04489750_2353 [Branchiibius hedensis]
MAQLSGDSTNPSKPAVSGIQKAAGGDGVWGQAQRTGRGVVGVTPDGSGVWGEVSAGRGVVGVVNGETDDATGVWGEVRTGGRGVVGVVDGGSDRSTGVWGEVKSAGHGVVGVAGSGGVGVAGTAPNGDGVVGNGHRGVVGLSEDFQGVYGHSVRNAGVVGESDEFDGVFGVAHRPEKAAVSGHNPGGMAGFFDGDVVVQRNVIVVGDVLLQGADCAEEFDVSEHGGPEPGAVLVIDPSGGGLRESSEAYDARVAGVVSGAGEYRPGLILDRQDEAPQSVRVPIAMVGKVYCKVDADHRPIEIGDLLTSSPTTGHAMKAQDRSRAFGAVIGKALGSISSGQGLIPVLVAMQ